MAMSKCPKCSQVLCDAGLYHSYKKQKATGLKDLIKCPSCNYIASLKKFIEALRNG